MFPTKIENLDMRFHNDFDFFILLLFGQSESKRYLGFQISEKSPEIVWVHFTFISWSRVSALLNSHKSRLPSWCTVAPRRLSL